MKPEISKYGTERWYTDDGKHYHRLDGPAIKFPDGTMGYYQNGLRHREDGPAIVWPNGDYAYYQHGELHRDIGPSAFNSGDTYYHKNGKLHNEHGPAIYHKYGKKVSYYINGEIPLVFGNMLIIDRKMIFRSDLDSTVWYRESDHQGYRFDDPDELALAILHYS